jgi:nitrogen fixation protein NifX
MNELTNDRLNIAFATDNQTHLNEHFGSCQKFTIYSLSPDSYEHLQTIDFMACEGHNQQKINDRLAALQDCFAVYCLACGNPVRQQLMANGIRVVIHPQPELIENIIPQIQASWPGKIASRQQRQTSRKKDADYFNQLADSEWEDSEWN